MEAEVTRHGSHAESRMRENCTYGSMRGSRRKTAKSVLRVVEDRAGVPDNKGRSALLYTLLSHGKDAAYPTALVAISTLLSVVTLPVVVSVAMHLFGN